MEKEDEKEKEKKKEANIDDENSSQNLEKKHFYKMFIIVSILFSVLLAAINSSHLILFYVYEKQPFFPAGWNPWYNVIYVIAFYMLLYSFVYIKSFQSSLKRSNDDSTQKKSYEMIFIYVGLAIFACSYALHTYTGWFILNFQPPNYISD